MKIIEKVRAYSRVMRSAKRPLDLFRLMRKRPALLLAVATYESALLASERVDNRLKALAQIKAGAMIDCPFCMDIGSAVGREMGIAEAKLRDLPRYDKSTAFDDDERLVLDFTVAMSKTPVEVPAALRERLSARFDEAALVELSAAIAWEQYRARFNRAMGVAPSGFSEGAFCVLPER